MWCKFICLQDFNNASTAVDVGQGEEPDEDW